MRVTSRKTAGLALVLGWALHGGAVQAAGIDCQRAQSQVEQAICRNPALQTLDNRLNAVYAEALQRQPERKAALLAEQKDWLRQREGCGGEAACLRTRYLARQEALLLGLSVPLDATDAQAVQALQHALEAQRALNAEFTLEKTLQSFTIREGLTTFANVEGTDSMNDAAFPTRRPAGVSVDEWAALQRSNIDGGGENGAASYTLLDLDGDGQRDLIMDTYVGGTGLFNAVNVLLRKGARFVGLVQGRRDMDEPDDFYTLNGRGSNQRAYWIRLLGRVYVAYVEGAYGRDEVTLLRPVGHPSRVSGWTLRYRYAFSVPAQQEGQSKAEGRRLSAMQLVALRKGLEQVNEPQPQAASGPVCPPPPGATEAEAQAYQDGGPTHYSFEVVKDFPVWLGRECRIGRLVDWFGRYDEQGLALLLWVTPPGHEDRQESFQVHARRQLVGIEGGRLGSTVVPTSAAASH